VSSPRRADQLPSDGATLAHDAPEDLLDLLGSRTFALQALRH
jgi:hypothetical protein